MTSGSESTSLDLSFSLVTEAEAPVDVDGGDLEALATFVLANEDAAGLWEVTVALVADDRLQQIHRDFMGIDTPTDIMTFPADESAGEARGGELAISVDHAMTQGLTWDHSPEEEITFLVAHGLLHLAGWRDDTEEQRQRMLARQHELIDRWRRQSPPERC